MAYTVLYIILIFMIAVFAIVFICYRSRTDQPASLQPSDMQAASVLYSRRGFAPTLVITRPHQRYNRYSGKVPTPSTVIANLPCMNYESPSQHSNDGKEETSEDELPQCVICCCAFQEQEKVKLLPCLHMYHEECIDAWLQRDHICPICQADVILAAGLSLGTDWSAHTLESVNTVSGAARHGTARATAAADDTDAGTAAAGVRPSTAPAAISRQQQQQTAQPLSAAADAAQDAHAVQLAALQGSANGSGGGGTDGRAALCAEHVVLTMRPLAVAGTSHV